MENNHKCRICGKEYYACDYCNQTHNFVPWRAVCCTFECYQKYLDLVLEARGEIAPVTVETTDTSNNTVITEVIGDKSESIPLKKPLLSKK